MGECSTLSQNLPSGSGLCGIKRSHSSDDSDDSTNASKVLKGDDTHRLIDSPERRTDPGSEIEFAYQEEDTDDSTNASEVLKNDETRRLIDSPERHTDPGDETEFSYQEELTDLCCRSSQSSSSEWSERRAVGHVEFEIRSPIEAPNPFGDSSTATDASVNEFQVVGLPPPKFWDDTGDSSCVSSGSSDVFDPEIPRRDYWTCLQCNNINNRPAFRYCEKCYKVRRAFYQPRTKPRKRRKRKSSKGATTPRSFTPGKANIEKGNAKEFQPSSTTCGETVKNCDGPKTSPVAFTGIKLESCSQENKDSGVACSQSSGLGSSQDTLATSQPTGGKDSDSSLSTDSGADTREFHGVKLLSTRVPSSNDSSLKLSSKQSVDVVAVLSRVTRQHLGVADSQSHASSRDNSLIGSEPWIVSGGVDEVGLVQLSQSGGVDEFGSVQPNTNQCVEKVNSPRPAASRGFDEVDTPQSATNRGVDEVDSVRTSTTCSVDEVDTVWPINRGVDEVDSLRTSTSRGVEEVDTLRPINRGADEVDSLRTFTSRGVDEVDTVCPINRGADEVDTLWTSVSRGVDEVDTLRTSVSRGVDEVDTLRTSVSRGVDEVDFAQPSTSRGVDALYAVRPSTSRGIDEVDSVQTSASPGAGKVDLVSPSSSQSVDEVDSVHPSVSRTAEKVDLMRPASSQSVNEVESLQPHLSQCVDGFDSVQNPSSQSFDEVDSARFASSQSLDNIDSTSSTVTRGGSKVSVSKLRSVKSQTDLCFISKSDVPKENPTVDLEKCMTCFSRPLDGIFIHSTYAHMCCCYKCTVKVWKTSMRCPLCNCKVMNVLRVFKGV